MPIPVLEKLIQRQLNHWNRMREFLERPGDPDSGKPRPIITVSRQAGSGGRMLAEQLGEALGLPVHDKSLVEHIAQDANLEQELAQRLDERVVSQAHLWVEGVLKQKIFLRSNYQVALVRTITHLAAPGGVIFLGRGAELILGEKADLRLRVVGSTRTRLGNIMRWTGLSRMEARAILQETDKRRDEFIRGLFKVDPWDPVHYDLVLNADRMTVDEMTDLVLAALMQNAPRNQVAARA